MSHEYNTVVVQLLMVEVEDANLRTNEADVSSHSTFGYN